MYRRINSAPRRAEPSRGRRYRGSARSGPKVSQLYSHKAPLGAAFRWRRTRFQRTCSSQPFGKTALFYNWKKAFRSRRPLLRRAPRAQLFGHLALHSSGYTKRYYLLCYICMLTMKKTDINLSVKHRSKGGKGLKMFVAITPGCRALIVTPVSLSCLARTLVYKMLQSLLLEYIKKSLRPLWLYLGNAFRFALFILPSEAATEDTFTTRLGADFFSKSSSLPMN